MIRIRKLVITAAILAATAAAPAMADPGHGKRDHHRGPSHSRTHCPPGLAKKNPPCIPPGQVHHHEKRYGNRVGDILRIGEYIVIRDPRRYNLSPRADWRYYRDDNRIYRIDSNTRKVLAVLNLIDALAD